MMRLSLHNKDISVKDMEQKEEKDVIATSEPMFVANSPRGVAENEPEETLSQTDQELIKKSGGAFSSFCAFPADTRFAGETEKEKIVLLLRAHFITNLYWIIITILLIIIPPLIIPLLALAKDFVAISFRANAFMIASFAWYSLVFTYAYLKFLYWYFNVYIITTDRLVDIDWYSVTYHKTSTALLPNIQDVSVSQIGVIPSLFDFGDIHIQTAGEEVNIDFLAVVHPQIVAMKINELIKNANETK